jgi:hypothetical protein
MVACSVAVDLDIRATCLTGHADLLPLKCGGYYAGARFGSFRR